jgi:hypothetical protein
MAIFRIRSLVDPNQQFDVASELLAFHIGYENMLVFEATRQYYLMIYNNEMTYGKAVLDDSKNSITVYFDFQNQEAFDKFIQINQNIIDQTNVEISPFTLSVVSEELTTEPPDFSYFKILSPDAEYGENYFFLEFAEQT